MPAYQVRVGVNALATRSGGGMAHLSHLLTHLGRLPSRPECVVVATPQTLARIAAATNWATVIPVDTHSLAHRVWWEQVHLPRLFRGRDVNVVLGLNNIGLLWADLPTVVMIQNVDPLIQSAREVPRTFSVRMAALRRLTVASARRARRVMAVSQYAGDLLRARTRADLWVDVVPLGAPDDAGSPPPTNAYDRLAALGLRRPYLLSVSSIKYNKNYVRLVEAFAKADLPGLDLVIAGGVEHPWAEQAVHEAIRKHGMEGRLKLIGAVDGPMLRAIYAGALALVMPSLLESFGLPALEAMGYGLAVAASEIPALREVCGHCALYFDPYRVEAIAGAMRTIANEEALRRRLAADGSRRAQTFRWSDVAERTLGVLAAAAERRTREERV